MQHKIGGRNLELSMYTPKKETPKRHRSHEPTEEEEEAPPRTVVVMVGQQPLESEDTYTLYFESPRHGGGEVEDVDIDEEKKLIYITFVDPAGWSFEETKFTIGALIKHLILRWALSASQ